MHVKNHLIDLTKPLDAETIKNSTSVYELMPSRESIPK